MATQKPANWNRMGVKSRAAWFMRGKVTVGTLSTFNEEKRDFNDFFVGRLRGRIVMHPVTREYKFKTSVEARECAVAFKNHCIRQAEGRA